MAYHYYNQRSYDAIEYTVPEVPTSILTPDVSGPTYGFRTKHTLALVHANTHAQALTDH